MADGRRTARGDRRLGLFELGPPGEQPPRRRPRRAHRQRPARRNRTSGPSCAPVSRRSRCSTTREWRGSPGGWIFSGTNWLYKTDDDLHEVMHLSPAIPDAWKAKGFDHIGDIDVVGKYIYAPFEEPDYSKGHQATARYDVDTLKFVDAVMLPQHQNSFVTIDPATMTAYTMDEFDGSSLLRYDVDARRGSRSRRCA